MRRLVKICFILLDRYTKFRVNLAYKVYKYKALVHRKNRAKHYLKLKKEKKAISFLSRKQRALSIYALHFTEDNYVANNKEHIDQSKVSNIRVA